MTKRILAILPALFLLAACGKKTPNCSSPEAISLVQKQVAGQLVNAGATGYSETEVTAMIGVSDIQTISADKNVDSYNCKSTATISYPAGLADKMATVSENSGALLYDIPKLLAQKYGLNAVGMSTKLAGIIMHSGMQGIKAKDTFTAALEKDNHSAVTYDIVKTEKGQNNMHFGVNSQLPDMDFVNKTVFYMNIAPVIMTYTEQGVVEEGTNSRPAEQESVTTAPAHEEAKPEVKATEAPADAAKPTAPVESTPIAKPSEAKPAAEAKPAEAPTK